MAYSGMYPSQGGHGLGSYSQSSSSGYGPSKGGAYSDKDRVVNRGYHPYSRR